MSLSNQISVAIERHWCRFHTIRTTLLATSLDHSLARLLPHWLGCSLIVPELNIFVAFREVLQRWTHGNVEILAGVTETTSGPNDLSWRRSPPHLSLSTHTSARGGPSAFARGGEGYIASGGKISHSFNPRPSIYKQISGTFSSLYPPPSNSPYTTLSDQSLSRHLEFARIPTLFFPIIT
jgi:hypothetical protein